MRASSALDAGSRIRRFSADDLPAVAGLYARTFARPTTLSKAEAAEFYSAYLEDIFLNSPWRNHEIGSLVCESNDGRVAGFLGVVPRRFSFREEEIVAAVSSHFMSDPRVRAPFAGVQLLRAFLSGPQDMSFTDESNDASRALWEQLGGGTLFSQSVRWTWPVRPLEYGAGLAGGKLRFHPAERSVRALARMSDRLAAALRFGPFAPARPKVTVEELDRSELAECIAESGSAVRPAYDEPSLNWLLDRATGMRQYGVLRKMVVRDPAGGAAGWFVYYLQSGGKCEVLQVFAQPKFAVEVVRGLLYDAWQGGGAAVVGSLAPRLLPAFGGHELYVWRRGGWTLIHSRNPELLDAIYRGDAFVSRLDGEWCQTHLTVAETGGDCLTEPGWER